MSLHDVTECYSLIVWRPHTVYYTITMRAANASACAIKMYAYVIKKTDLFAICLVR